MGRHPAPPPGRSRPPPDGDDPGKVFVTGAFFGRGGATVFAVGFIEPTGSGILSWDAKTGRPEGRHTFDGGAPVALNPDGRLLVIAEGNAGVSTADRSAVWDLTAGKPARLWSLAGAVTAAQFGPGGRLVTAVRSETGAVVRVWDEASGRPLTPAVTRTRSRSLTAGGQSRWYRPAVDPGRFRRGGAKSVLTPTPGRHPEAPAAREVLDARFTPDGRGKVVPGSVVRWDCGPADDPALLARPPPSTAGKTRPAPPSCSSTG